MNAASWTEAATIPPAYKTIRERGLEKNLEELEAYGLTVLTPEQIGNPKIVERAREAVLRIAEERTGVRHDIETGAHGKLEADGSTGCQYLLFSFLEEDPVFEEMIQHPTTLPLVEY
ncbi:MAG: hypothetical protein OXM56_06895, partial [Gammaproteobacteria bacterium]|nr:hypothetical protein [Gammaproteobacteria bacterium]